MAQLARSTSSRRASPSTRSTCADTAIAEGNRAVGRQLRRLRRRPQEISSRASSRSRTCRSSSATASAAIATLFADAEAGLKGLVQRAGPEGGGGPAGAAAEIAGVLGKLTHSMSIWTRGAAQSRRPRRVPRGIRFVAQGKGPARTGAQLLAAMEKIQADMEKLDVPLLLLHRRRTHGSKTPDGRRELHKRAASKDKTLEVFDGLVHDLLHEAGEGDGHRKNSSAGSTRARRPQAGLRGPRRPRFLFR